MPARALGKPWICWRFRRIEAQENELAIWLVLPLVGSGKVGLLALKNGLTVIA
jgi:hypothetical protein